jgi:hypothetical protein
MIWRIPQGKTELLSEMTRWRERHVGPRYIFSGVRSLKVDGLLRKAPNPCFLEWKESHANIYIYILICMLSPLSIPIAPVPFGSQKTSPSTRSRCLVRWLPNMRDEVFRRPQSNEVLTQLWYMARNHMCNRVVVEYPQLCICVYNCIFVHMYV